MAEETAPTTGTEETNGQTTEPKEFAAITSQEDFDKAIQGRIARERAKFANYEEGQAAIAKLAEFEESQKSEAQKAQDALVKAQQELAMERTARTRAEVAASKGVPADLLSGSTQEELEASAAALIAFKGEQPKGPVIPNQGLAPQIPSDPKAVAFGRALGID